MFHVLGEFDLGIQIDALFFIGSQVVAISYTGKVGIWNSRMPRHWQVKKFLKMRCLGCCSPLYNLNTLKIPVLY